jgi:hypothetical protein
MTYVDSESETDTESIIMEEDDEIYEEDCDFLDADKGDRMYYIGLSGHIKRQNQTILLSSISPRTFLKHDGNDVLRYLVDYSTVDIQTHNTTPSIQILQLHIDDKQTYNVVNKTFWLKMVQRSWKRVYAQRQSVISSRKNPISLHHRQSTGKWGARLPSIYGMVKKSCDYPN